MQMPIAQGSRMCLPSRKCRWSKAQRLRLRQRVVRQGVAGLFLAKLAVLTPQAWVIRRRADDVPAREETGSSGEQKRTGT